MMGAIAGDIIGSAHERAQTKTTEFELFCASSRFTDDSVMTLAIAEAITAGKGYRETLQAIGRRYPNAGYGRNFLTWLLSDDEEAYGSWGNGSAMRVSPIGFAFNDESTVLREAELSAAITHDHPEGIKGAQAVALAIWMARHKVAKEYLRKELAGRFDYDLDRTVEQIRPTYAFDVSCQGSVPEAIIAFLDSHDWESAVRNAVSLGGDADTQACIAGAIAEAWYGEVPGYIAIKARHLLPTDLKDILDRFEARFLR